MSGCCASRECGNDHPAKRRCPACGRACAEVSVRTILHHLRAPWEWEPPAARCYFCDDPACDVVYFAEDGALIRKSDLRTQVGAKEPSDGALLCYCFGVSRGDYRRFPGARDFVTAQTRAGLCSCATSNPSGRCCLKDFP